MTEPAADVRALLDRALGESINDVALREIIAASLEAKKKPWAEITCKHCRKVGKYQVEINDVAAVVKALEVLMNQAKGRPDVAQQGEQDRIVFERVVYMDDVEGSPV